MNKRAAFSLSLLLGAAIAATCLPAVADEPAALAPSPVAAAKYIVHVDGMT
jgi:hypothetical protein